MDQDDWRSGTIQRMFLKLEGLVWVGYGIGPEPEQIDFRRLEWITSVLYTTHATGYLLFVMR